jgi:hypothetical protein
MSVNDAAIEPGEDKAHRGPWMDEQFPACQQFHHVLQQGLMREAVKRFEREDKLIDFFVSGVSVGTRRRLDSSPVDRIYVCIGPASDFQDRRDFAQEAFRFIGRKQTPDEGIAVISDLLPQGQGIDVSMRDMSKRLQSVDLGATPVETNRSIVIAIPDECHENLIRMSLFGKPQPRDGERRDGKPDAALKYGERERRAACLDRAKLSPYWAPVFRTCSAK